MLKRCLIIYSLLLGPGLVLAENAIPVGGAPDEVPESKAVGSLTVSDEQMQFILEDSSTKQKYDRCKEMFGSTTLDTSVSECLWEGKYKDPDTGTVSNDPNSPLSLTENERGKLVERINALGSETAPQAEGETSRAPAEVNKDKYESLDTGFLKEANQDPSFKAINDYMVKKLEETIYGKAEKGKLNLADHRVFHTLYKSQLSKNVIQAMSSFCLDAEIVEIEKTLDTGEKVKVETFVVTEDKIKEARKKNIENLKNAEVAKERFSGCIGALKDICYKKGDYSGTEAYSSERACNVVTYVKQLKQNIIAVQQIQDRFKELKMEEPNGVSLGTDNQQVKVYVDEKNDELTNMSSKDFIEESGFKDKVAAEKAEFEKCYTQDPDDKEKWVFTGDAEACKRYLNEDAEEASKIITEADTRLRGLQEKLKNDLKDDPETTTVTYLTDQGYTQEEIDAIKSDPEKMEKIRGEINSRYEAERKALIASLAKKIKGKTLDTEEPALDKGDNKTRLEEIGKELANRTQSYTELIHFNNIVSGFLETEDKNSGARGQNTSAMAYELEGSAYRADPDGRTPADEHISAIEEGLNAAGIKPEKSPKGSKEIEQGDINEIFQYDALKKPTEP